MTEVSGVMAANGTIETTGEVISVLGNNNYQVKIMLGEREHVALCHLSGKMRQFKINVVIGDNVKIQIPPPYNKGRITFREK